jgi:hypothetical protein
MNWYLDKLGSLDEKRTYPRHPQNPRNHPKRGFVGFEGRSDYPYASALAALRAICPPYVSEDRWQQAVADATTFISKWGAQAQAFGWTARELFGLHPVPEQPAPSYRRLSRYDETGLIWLLRGRPVRCLDGNGGGRHIQGATAVLIYRKLHKPALGPVGDSLDDVGALT